MEIIWEAIHWLGIWMCALVLVSLSCLVLGLRKRSGWLMLGSALTVLPMSAYLFGAENAWKWAILIPVAEGIVAIVFWLRPAKARG